LHELAEKIIEYEEVLTTVSDICGELDRYLTLPSLFVMFQMY